MKFLFFLIVFLPFSLFSQTATKQDIQLLIKLMEKQFEQVDKRFEQIDKRFEQIDEQIEILREDMNKQIEILREDINERLRIIYWLFGGVFTAIFSLMFYIWQEFKQSRSFKYDIVQLENQLYLAEPHIKARIYFHLKQEAEKYQEKHSVSS